MGNNRQLNSVLFFTSFTLLLSILMGCDLGSYSSGKSFGDPGEGGPPGSGFLWKPVSESNSKLVVLLPTQYTGDVSGVFVANSSGDILDQGAFGGVHNGDREHYRFPKPGASYGDNVYVVADLKDGTSVYWIVADGSERTQL